jgi:predicted metal-dependent phosphoesterase TrpH
LALWAKNKSYRVNDFNRALPFGGPQKYTETKLAVKDRWADLHIHTVKSDGTCTVEEIFERAKTAGVEAIAITDHDTSAGVEEALYMEKKYGVEFVPGVELSAMYGGREVHIVGLYIDWRDKSFAEKLVFFQKKRVERAKKIIKKLKEHGVSIKYEELYEITDNMGNAGRLHIARLMMGRKLVKSIKEAFEKYLSEGAPAYVEKEKITVKEAIDIIQGVGGVAVIAHPGSMNRDEMIETWKAQGMDGIEVFHPDHGNTKAGHYMDIAKQNNLLVSGGSDFHGSHRHGGIGDIKLPYEFFEKIRDYYRANGGKGK